MPYPVKSYQSTQTGAPQLTHLPGTLVAVLDACLLNGFNLKPLDSLTFAAGKAIATVSTGHGYRTDDIVLIAGADQAAFNGEQRITAATTTTFEFAVSGAPPAVATGTLTAKIAPIGGWEKVYSASNKAAYRAVSPQSNRLYVLVDDSENYRANVWMCEDLSDIATATNPSPSAVTTKRLRWRKCTTSESGARSWALIGDAMLFFVLPKSHTNYGRGLVAFGDVVSYRSGDAFNTLLIGEDNPNDANVLFANDYNDALNCYGGSTGHFMARSAVQLGAAVNVGKVSLATNANGGVYSGFSTGLTFPNVADYALLLHPVYIKDNLCLRGVLPGYYCLHQDQPLTDAVVIDHVVGYPDKRFILYTVGYSSSAGGRIAFDLTGPWR